MLRCVSYRACLALASGRSPTPGANGPTYRCWRRSVPADHPRALVVPPPDSVGRREGAGGGEAAAFAAEL